MRGVWKCRALEISATEFIDDNRTLNSGRLSEGGFQ